VTRTWPVDGTFSARQREVYDIVLDTHRYSDDRRSPEPADCKGLCRSCSQLKPEVSTWRRMLMVAIGSLCGSYLAHCWCSQSVRVSYTRRCVDECRPGTTLQHLHALSVRLLREGLRSLGLLSAMAPSHAHRPFYPHAVGAHCRVVCSDAGLVSGGLRISLTC